MKKIIIFGIGNEKEFNHYTIEKTKQSHKILKNLFKSVFKIEWPLEEERLGDNDVPEIKKIDIGKNKDFHEIIGGWKNIGDDRVDVFYGDKKMFITLNCSLNKRKEFHKKLEKVARIIKPKK